MWLGWRRTVALTPRQPIRIMRVVGYTFDPARRLADGVVSFRLTTRFNFAKIREFSQPDAV